MRHVWLPTVATLSCSAPSDDTASAVAEGYYTTDPTDCTYTCEESGCPAYITPSVQGADIQILDVVGSRYALELSDPGSSGTWYWYDSDCELEPDGDFVCVPAPEEEDLRGASWTISGTWSSRKTMSGTAVLVTGREERTCTMTTEFTARWWIDQAGVED